MSEPKRKYAGSGNRRLWKSEEFDGLRPTCYDWARIAAFIDGEGHVNMNPCRGNTIARLLIGNTNQNLPIWLQRTFGGNVVLRLHKNPKWKHQYIWSCTAARSAWILFNCLPWMLLKNEQARLLMALQESVDTTRQGRNRHVAAEVLAARVELKRQLHVLNAKGPSVQNSVGTEE